MNRVGQKRHGASHDHQHQLEQRGHPEHDQADLDRPDSLGTGFQRGIHGIGGVMAVRPEQFAQGPTHSPGVLVPVLVPVVMVMVNVRVAHT